MHDSCLCDRGSCCYIVLLFYAGGIEGRVEVFSDGQLLIIDGAIIILCLFVFNQTIIMINVYYTYIILYWPLIGW